MSQSHAASPCLWWKDNRLCGLVPFAPPLREVRIEHNTMSKQATASEEEPLLAVKRKFRWGPKH